MQVRNLGHIGKSGSFAVIWMLTGSLAIAGAMALVEPLANAVALYFFDRWWHRPRRVAPTRLELAAKSV